MTNNLKLSLSWLTFILFNIFSLMIINLYYPSDRSPDLNRYSNYLEYFSKNSESTNLEQGLLYFFIVFIFLNFFETFNSLKCSNKITN